MDKEWIKNGLYGLHHRHKRHHSVRINESLSPCGAFLTLKEATCGEVKATGASGIEIDETEST